MQSQPSLTSRQTTDSGPGLVELDGSIMEGVGGACMWVGLVCLE